MYNPPLKIKITSDENELQFTKTVGICSGSIPLPNTIFK